jgi:L-ascorbate metabolism protein UlaG (beta-lactamase superfamily)
MLDRIQWLGHAGFRIQGPPLIYINPWHIARNAFHADAILVTTDECDHCSPADIEKLRGPYTTVIASPAAAAALGGGVTVLRPWQCLNIGSARVTAVPAYTYSHHHPVSKGDLGFVISVDYYDIYYAGITDYVPELSNIRADVAILPVAAGQGSMSLERLRDLVQVLGPGAVIPSHWGTVGGTRHDVRALERLLADQADVVTLDRLR